MTHAPAAEPELANVGERFAAIVEHGFDLIVIVGADRCLRYASPGVGTSR